MSPDQVREVTELLQAWSGGDQTAFNRLFPLVYEELRRLARSHLRRERPGHALQTTARVHEVYLRLTKAREVDWRNRVQFFALSGQVMRHVLVDAARERQAAKRGGHAAHVSIDDADGVSVERGADLVALDDALHALGRLIHGSPRGGASLLRRAGRRGNRRGSVRLRRDGHARLENGQTVAASRAPSRPLRWPRRAMKPERWRQIEDIFHSAAVRNPAERSLFLDTTCRGDAQLRQEVESLLDQESRVKTFLETPTFDVVALRCGTRVGPYEVIALIGAGGMGEVYRARDSA